MNIEFEHIKLSNQTKQILKYKTQSELSPHHLYLCKNVPVFVLEREATNTGFQQIRKYW